MSPLPAETLREAALGEIAALALKAARGAGYDWGMADEAADAVRVLHGHGLAGARLLVAALDGPQDSDPVRHGALLSDRAAFVCAGEAEALPPLTAPALVLPFLLRAAARQGRALRVLGGSTRIVCLPDGGLCGHASADVAPVALQIAPAEPPFADPLPRFHRAWVAETDWDRLSELAARTYAPATEASRLRGAGAAEDAEG